MSPTIKTLVYFASAFFGSLAVAGNYQDPHVWFQAAASAFAAIVGLWADSPARDIAAREEGK
jgi:hypothetical protein